MTRYFVKFVNQTGQDKPWILGVYQELPNSVGLDSVSWQQTAVPKGGKSTVSWDIIYNVALANYQQSDSKGVYESTQILETYLGKYWDIVFEDGVQQLVPGTPPAGVTVDQQQIVIANKSKLLANPGIGVSGTGSVFKQNVLNGASAQFTVTPTYWAGLFTDLELGEVIKHNIAMDPIKIVFPDGMNAATITLSIEGSSYHVVTEYSIRNSFEIEMVQTFIASLAELAR